MLKILGRGATLCDGISRREFLRVGGLSLFGSLTLPRLLRAADVLERRRARAKSVILFNLLGGPSHLDMFDLKPNAPAEVRGEFQPIATSVTGLRICEHLPNIARMMHKACLIRTISHNYNSHDPLPIMTGFTGANPALQAQPSDPPDIGAICQYLGIGPRDLPGAVCLPCFPGSGESYKRGGPYGGFLGSQYDPLFALCNPTFSREPHVNYYDPVMPIGEPYLPGLDQLPEMTVRRFDARQALVQQVDRAFEEARRSPAAQRMGQYQQRAFAMLTSSRTRDAFNLSREPDRIRDRYGRHLYGASLLVARRLVEAGVPFVSVHQEIFRHYGHAYDMHENNFQMLKDFNLPLLDQVYPALIDDLEARGLLDETLVIVMGEMGRTPRINAKAGRDHWPQCTFSLLTGGGVRRGTVYGTSDEQAAYPVSHLVRPADLVATIYHLLGIDPHMTVNDRLGRPVPIAHGGEPVQGVLA
jgi:Protein of unknown function (DUF1501)